MNDNILTIPGLAGSHPPNTAVDEIVEKLKDLLAEAERGEIVGFLFGSVRPTRAGISTGWVPGTATATDMLAAASGVYNRISLVWVQSVNEEG